MAFQHESTHTIALPYYAESGKVAATLLSPDQQENTSSEIRLHFSRIITDIVDCEFRCSSDHLWCALQHHRCKEQPTDTILIGSSVVCILKLGVQTFKLSTVMADVFLLAVSIAKQISSFATMTQWCCVNLSIQICPDCLPFCCFDATVMLLQIFQVEKLITIGQLVENQGINDGLICQ